MSLEDKIHIRPSKELQDKFKEQGERNDVFLALVFVVIILLDVCFLKAN